MRIEPDPGYLGTMNPFTPPCPLDLTEADTQYIREHFVPLEALCRGRPEMPGQVRQRIEARELPAPTYWLADGTPMFPREYFRLWDEHGPQLRSRFVERWLSAARRAGADATLAAAEDEWDGYLRGVYFACLREVTPENVFRKEALVRSLDALIADARPQDPAWCARLRAELEALDGLEMPFCGWDRLRFGRPVSRERVIDGPRRRWRSIFDAAATVR